MLVTLVLWSLWFLGSPNSASPTHSSALTEVSTGANFEAVQLAWELWEVPEFA